MPRTAEVFGSSIVAVGAFNPAIFTPDWLERYQLVGSADAEAARSSSSIVVSHQVTSFETDWFSFQVLENQFSLTSKGALDPRLKDLAVGIFTLVPHTPVNAIGLNFLGHYRLSSQSDFHKVGDVLAPKDIWSRLFPEENRSAGLASLTVAIIDGTRDQFPETGNRRNITVQPSTQVKCGVFCSYNDHRVIRVEPDSGLPIHSSAEQAGIVVDSEWQKTWDDSLRVFDGIVTQALATDV